MSPTGREYDAGRVRAEEFPWADRATYMNAASSGPLPERSRRAVEEFNRIRHEAYRLDADRIVGALSEAREVLARLVGADAEEIAVAPNTSWGLNVAAGVLRRRGADSRRRIVVSDREFPANVYPWMALESEGFVVDRVSTDAGGLPREQALLERLDGDDVAALAISAVQFASGFRADLERFGRACRDRDILFVVDGIQAVGAVPLDVRAAKVDVLACGGQKWLCGPFGSGFAYIRSDLCRAVEPLQPAWMAFESSTDFTRLLDYRYELLPDARRFEIGTIGVQDIVGLTRSAELLLEIGIDEVWRHIRAVQEPLLEWAGGRRDITVSSDRAEAHRSPILCIRPPDADRAHGALRDGGVVCALREGGIRIAPHFYNTAAEMDAVVEILERTVEG